MDPSSPDPRPARLEDLPADLAIAVSVNCRGPGCGYDLRGLTVDSHCPECGTSVATSLRAVIDPQASELPRLSNPEGVGNGLVWIIAATLVAAVALLLDPVVLWLRLESHWAWLDAVPLVGRSEDLPLVSAVAALLGLVGVVKLAPAGGDDRGAVWRTLGLLAVGFVGWSVLTFAMWWRLQMNRAGEPMHLFLQLGRLAVAAVIMLGLGGVLGLIGQRSPAYRRLHAARQGARTMIAALAAIGAGVVLRHLGVSEIGAIFICVSALMIVIGLAYMLINARWIRRALRRPPPRIDELLRRRPGTE